MVSAHLKKLLMRTLKQKLYQIYFGSDPSLAVWRWVLIAFDILLLLFFVITTFVEHSRWFILADYAIGVVLLLDWMTRLWVTRDRIGFLTRPIGVVDLAVILSLFAPSVTENFIFLRVLRTLRLLRSYHVLRELRDSIKFFARHEQIIFSATNLLVFIFVVSAGVYALQARVNDEINNYIDALYFTITTLTTTGFGDITMQGQTGRLLAVVIMIVGVSLFLRLIQSIFRPNKVEYDCPDCGLARHDHDAVHCKHCGRILKIHTEGVD